MYPSTNTRSGLTALIEKNYSVPPTPTIEPYITISELNSSIQYIHTDMKAFHEKTGINIKFIN